MKKTIFIINWIKKIWFKLFGKKVIGVDLATKEDYGCIIKGRMKNGHLKINEIIHTPKKENK